MARDGTESGRDADQAVVLAWIKTHWEELATLAWRGYVTAGRGVLVLEGDWQGAVAVGYQTAAEDSAVCAAQHWGVCRAYVPLSGRRPGRREALTAGHAQPTTPGPAHPPG